VKIGYTQNIYINLLYFKATYKLLLITFARGQVEKQLTELKADHSIAESRVNPWIFPSDLIVKKTCCFFSGRHTQTLHKI